MSISCKLQYLSWAALRCWNANLACPACNEARTVLVRRKYLVTALYRCTTCEVMFRVPKPTVEECDEFYQSGYRQRFTADCPGPEELAKLKNCSFAGSAADYSNYISVLRAIPLEPGSTILDFGCSWGYGSWQLSRAGYKVYSYELSRPRARYAAEKLDCELLSPQQLPERVDCFFAAHVIEHLPKPRDLWETAQNVVKPGGKVVLFLPNGEPARERVYKAYHRIWGLVHPLLLSPAALTRMGERSGFEVHCYSSPYDAREISERMPGSQTGDELLAVASHG
jgi:2-polyprenyl-3-methyl-5-hydroxy-6-metoxy-1,4-benzoquinol methylase